MHILIAAKQNKSGLRAAKRVHAELKKHTEVHFDLSTALHLHKARGIQIKKFKGDLIITLGGDGTFLWAAYQANAPILPVRIEGHGFLCTIDYKDFLKNMPSILQKKYQIIKRMRLKAIATKYPSKKSALISKILHKEYPMAVNEIAFARKRPSKVLHIDFTIDGTTFHVPGDGILIATPSGSTAYAASAGASMLDPTLEAISIVPLYPFHSKIKPMIIPAGKKIEVTIRSGDCAFIVDGHTGEYAKQGTTFVVERGEPVKVVTLSEHNFYERYKRVFLENE